MDDRCTLCNGEGTYLDSTSDGTAYYQTCISCGGSGYAREYGIKPPVKVHELGGCPWGYEYCDGVAEWTPDPYSLEISDLYLYDYRCDGECAYASDEI